MLVDFRHKGLRELFFKGASRKVAPVLQKRCRRRLDALDAATSLDDLNLPSFRLHALHGFEPTRHAIAVDGPWRITFTWTDNGPAEVDLEQYH